MAPSDLRLRLSKDRMTAAVDLSARRERPPSVDEVRAAAVAAGVVHGLDPTRLEAELARWRDDPAADPHVVVATGTPPSRARVEKLELARDSTPSEPEDRIDFREQGRFVSVRRGARLALWTPPRDGKPGKRVDGIDLPAGLAAEARFELGEHVALEPADDDCFHVIATTDGALVVERHWRVSVVDVLRIEGDVDLSTGNVDSTGSVVVTGSVRSSFRVTAAHDLEVHGTIEDAEVRCGGRLVARGGIVGGNFGGVRAGASLWARHTQNARIECEGDVTLGDSDLASVIVCGGALKAVEGRGRLSGGAYEAARGVVAQELGSPLGAATAIRVGVDRVGARRMVEARQQLARLDAEVDAVLAKGGREGQTMRLGREQARLLREAIRLRVELRGELERLELRATEFDEFVRTKGLPTVEARRTVHGGVSVDVRGVRHLVDERSGPRTFALDPATGEVA